MGGRQARTDEKYGNIYDHHSVCYEYEDGTRLISNCRQQPGCFRNIASYVQGTRGRAEVSERQLKIEAETSWRFRDKTKNMYQVEHDELFASIRDGRAINNGDTWRTARSWRSWGAWRLTRARKSRGSKPSTREKT